MRNIVLQAGAFDPSSLIMLFAFIAVFYFFMIRPQVARQKKEKKFQEEIKKGAYVIMTSGIHGRVAEVNANNNTVVIETGAGKIRFQRTAISMDMTTNWNKEKEKDSKN